MMGLCILKLQELFYKKRVQVMNDDMKSQIDLLSLEMPFLAKEIIYKQYELQPEFHKYGAKGIKHSLEDAKYNLEYLFSALELESKQLFEQYNSWVKELFTNLKLPVKTLENFYDCTNEVMEKRFQRGQIDEGLFAKLIEYINHGILVLRNNTCESNSNVQNENPLKSLLDRYTNYVLSGDKSSATNLIMDIIRADTEVKDIYKYILQPFQIELGRLWHKNQINVAEEHYATALSQFAMSLLYEKIFFTPKNNKVFLGT
jgi:MerR family transcriptional regulator, light-induced transcriptional regulator